MMTADEIMDGLTQFTGTDQWYRHPLARNVLYTDGVRWLAEAGGAYWLIDAVASHSIHPRIRGEEITFWRLRRKKDKPGAMLEARLDSDLPAIVRQNIPYTDFPLEEIKLYLTWDGTNYVLMLPSEY